MRKETPADSGQGTSVCRYYGHRRSNYAQSGDLGARRAAWLAIPAAALLLTAALAACTSASAPRSAVAGPASQAAAAASSGHSSAPDAAPGRTPGRPSVLAAARRVTCPALDGAVSPPDRSLRAEPIPAGFHPVAVVECLRVPAILPVAGLETNEVRRVAFTGLDRLVAALRLPSTPRSRLLVPACIVLPVDAVPWVVLIGPGGQLLHPRVPIGACGLPIAPVQTSLNSLHWKTLSVTRLRWVGPRLPVEGSPDPNIRPAITAPQPGALS
jgi:hypothetical protein